MPHVPVPLPQVPSLGMAPLPPSGDAARARPGNAALWCDAAQHGTSASAHLFADLPPYAPQPARCLPASPSGGGGGGSCSCSAAIMTKLSPREREQRSQSGPASSVALPRPPRGDREGSGGSFCGLTGAAIGSGLAGGAAADGDVLPGGARGTPRVYSATLLPGGRSEIPRCELQWPGSAARAGPARASTPPDRLQGASGVSGRSHSVRTTPFLSASAAINAAQRRSTSTGAVEYFPTSAGRRYR